jgi:hypothetical protein
LLNPEEDQRMLTLQVLASTALLWRSHPSFLFTLLLPVAQLLCSRQTKPFCEWQEEIFK